jgi:hypothetical protein
MARINPKMPPSQGQRTSTCSRHGCRIGERLTLYWNEIMVTDLG